MVVDKDTKIDEVAAELKSRIDRGEYAAGQRLPSEREITDELNVSRATVRGALLRLQAENMIDIVPRGGAFVRSPSSKIARRSDEPGYRKWTRTQTRRFFHTRYGSTGEKNTHSLY